MMKKLSRFLLLLSVLVSGVACADEASVKKAMQAKFPKVNVESVSKAPYLGLYEVVVGGELVYTDEKANYLIDGNIIDMRTMVNLTDERKRKLTSIKFESLPLEMAIKKVKGNGKRKLAVFSDPDCPYCKRIEQDLAKLTNVTIYTFLYPVESLHPAAVEKAKIIWCSADQAKAWDDLMLKGVAPGGSGNCDNPVDKIVQYAQQNKIFGTPTLFFADGQRVPGAIPAAQLEKLLDAAQPR